MYRRTPRSTLRDSLFPSTTLFLCRNMLGRRQVGRAVERDLVVVPQDIEAAELQMAGEADGLVVDALHQAAVAGERPGTMIDQIVAEYGAKVPLRNGHADRHREALSQRSRRLLDPRPHEISGSAGPGRLAVHGW